MPFYMNIDAKYYKIASFRKCVRVTKEFIKSVNSFSNAAEICA